jgi:proteasome lid subunit RPN8/RPN11
MRAEVARYRPERLSRLLLCEPVIQPLERHLRTTGLECREEAALLAGYIVGRSLGLVTTVILPYTQSTAAGCELPLDVTIKCIDKMNHAGQIVLAQVHTHPGHAWHSETDNEWAFSDSPGLFSIVVPCFGRYGLRRIFTDGVAIYERLVTGEWYRLSSCEVRKRFLLIPSSRIVL